MLFQNISKEKFLWDGKIDSKIIKSHICPVKISHAVPIEFNVEF